ncbi:MAG TPA: hypothetical protein VGN88_11770 [Phycisphaerae bacterium]|jgi:hypothetical protein
MDNILEYAKPTPKPLPWNLVVFMAFFGWWGSALLGPLFLILLPTAITATILLILRKKWRPLVASLLLSPIAVSAARGALEYTTGTAHIEGMGLIRYPVNVDPVTGMQYSSGGCMVSGNEWITQAPHNLTVLALFQLFGKMPGAYNGPYPSELDAYAALAGAAPFDLPAFSSDRFLVAGKLISLRPHLGEDLLKGFNEGPGSDPSDPTFLIQYGQPEATLYAGTCVIIAIPISLPAPGVENRIIILLDAPTGKAFAIYRDGVPTSYRPVWNSLWE